MAFLQKGSLSRVFGFSVIATIVAAIAAFVGFGAEALAVALILIVVEITFSFENAIINARILAGMSRFWQNIFLTVGIVIAIFGMRIVFPIVIVMITAGLGWHEVIDLALNHPSEYAHELEVAHPQIAAFGGAFLLMLALHFFLDDNRETLWFTKLERAMQRIATSWMPAVISIVVLILLALLPFNDHKTETIVAGFLGIATYIVLNGLVTLFERIKGGDAKKAVTQTGFAALMSFIYLEVLDASFSFDGVIGAFAVTNEVILIALGLGVGAIWVRSLTVFMVRNGTLNSYKYLEHGAHYTVFVLSAVLLLGVFLDIPEVLAGLVGIGLIVSAIVSSRQARQATKRHVQ
jgi:hypothetical protein